MYSIAARLKASYDRTSKAIKELAKAGLLARLRWENGKSVLFLNPYVVFRGHAECREAARMKWSLFANPEARPGISGRGPVINEVSEEQARGLVISLNEARQRALARDRAVRQREPG